jgi:2-C-methyl-D-erythritol 4-phosphate cytidylyltransferase
MSTRAMIVVGGGSSSRFEGEKLLAEVAGKPLIWHTVSAVRDLVDTVILVSRPDIIEKVAGLKLGVETVPGGSTRTLSEMAGLAALGGDFDLIGIHDAARPLVRRKLVDQLFVAAESTGGAVPVQEPEDLLLERHQLRPVERPGVVQTPQVFRGPDLFAAYVRSAEADYDGHDTVEIVHRYGDLRIAAVPADPSNIKVTFPEDLEFVRRWFEDPSRSEPH